MKNQFITLLLCLSVNAVFGQEFLWAKRSYHPDFGSYSDGKSIGHDSSGNVYTAGYFSGSVDFDSTSSAGNMVSPNNDIFFAKYNFDGNFLWVKSIGSQWIDNLNDMKVDSLGNIYLTGDLGGQADFDPSNGVYLLSPQASYNSFVAKYNSDGDLQWAFNIGGTEFTGGSAITVDDQGNVYSAGSYYNTVDFDPGNLEYTMTSSGGLNIFLTKYTSAGEFVWAKDIGGPGQNDAVSGIAINVENGVVICGTFEDSADFDPSGTDFYLHSNGGRDLFTATYSPEGNLIWANSAGGVGFDDYPNSVKIDYLGNVYVVGLFSDDVIFYGVNSSEIILHSDGSYDGFFVKYDPQGTLIWCKKVGGIHDQGVADCCISKTGDIYLVIDYQGADTDVDLSESIDSPDLSDSISSTIIAKYDLNCSLVWMGILHSTYHGPEVRKLDLIDDQKLLSVGHFDYKSDFAISESEEFNMGTDIEIPMNFTFFVSEHKVNCINIQGINSSLVGCNSVLGTAHVEIADESVISSFNWEPGSPSGDGSDSVSGLYSGIWTCLITDTNGCSTNVVFNIEQSESQIYQIVDTSCGNYVLNGQTYSSSGIYYQNYQNTYGCDSILELDITINDTPIAGVTALDGLTLLAIGEALSYQWIDCATQMPVPGAQDSVFVPQYNGSYAVIMSDENCSSVSECLIIDELSLEELDEFVFQVIPNPANDFVLLHISCQGELSIYGTAGDLILDNKSVVPNESIHIGDIQPGAYFLVLKSNEQVFTQKLIKY